VGKERHIMSNPSILGEDRNARDRGGLSGEACGGTFER
jgi:hypothetical protein